MTEKKSLCNQSLSSGFKTHNQVCLKLTINGLFDVAWTMGCTKSIGTSHFSTLLRFSIWAKSLSQNRMECPDTRYLLINFVQFICDVKYIQRNSSILLLFWPIHLSDQIVYVSILDQNSMLQKPMKRLYFLRGHSYRRAMSEHVPLITVTKMYTSIVTG